MTQSREHLGGHLLIQCRPRQAAAAAEVASAHGGGLVISGAAAEPTARHLRERQGFTGPLLCDSDRYSGRPRVTAGRGILRGTARESQLAIAMLPIAARWFATPSICDALAREISRAGVPVAVAIEHAGDPFAARYVLQGFLRLLSRVNVPVLLLRSGIATFLSPMLSYHTGDTVKRIVAGTPEYEHLWPCRCPTCDGRAP